MKAIVQTGYGSPADVLEYRDTATPTADAGEVLVGVHAASVHPDVWHVVAGLPRVIRIMGAGLLTPRQPIPGTDVAGVVEAIGANVTRFHLGDEVFGECVRGHQWHNGGAFAEYVSVREEALEHKPANASFEEAAAVPTSALIALQGVRDEGQVKPGQSVLVNGAGGGVGAFAVQIAKAYEAEVTGVDESAKLGMLRSIGADHVIDYTREDFTEGDERYDLIIDIPGNHSLAQCRRVLTPDGLYVLIGHDNYGASGKHWIGSVGRALRLVALSPFISQLPKLRTSSTQDRLAVLARFLEAGKLTPVIDRTYRLTEVAQALHHLQEGSPRGKIVITM